MSFKSNAVIWRFPMSMPLKTLDVFQIPFYKAVTLFEAKDYIESFKIFNICFKKGNLYAPYYLQYILKNSPTLKLPKLSDDRRNQPNMKLSR